jgi:hypothetical protein
VKTRRETRRDAIARAYFEYWKLQNNPEYVKFYNETKALKSHPPIPDDKWGRIRFNMLRFGIWDKFDRRGAPYMKGGRKIIDPLPLVDPNKRINWSNIESGEVDEEITSIMGLNLFKPAAIRDVVLRDGQPIVFVSMNLRYDKSEILHSISEWIESLKKDRGIREALRKARDPLNKVPLYAQIWDLRRERKPFPEIARQMKIPTGTVRMRYYHAFELIYGHRYQPDLRTRIDKETLKKYCDICPDHRTCEILCPDILAYIAQDEVKRREVFVKGLDFDRFSLKRWEEQDRYKKL